MTFSDEGALVDEVLIKLRFWGPYMQVQFWLLMLAVLACGFHLMSVVFLGKPVEHKCAPVANLSITLQEGDAVRELNVMSNQSGMNLNVTYEACSIDVRNGTELLFTTTCIAGYEYTEPIDRSYVSQFDLVCDREAFSDFSQTILALGMMIGAFCFTALADRYGRKPTYLAGHLLLLIVSIAIAFSPNFTVFIILRFLLGGFQQGMGLVSSIMLVEMMPTMKRAFPSVLGNFTWAGTLILLCLIAYLARDISWRYTELILAASSAYVLVQLRLTDESLRWLVANRRLAEIELVLKKAARMNKTDPEPVLALLRRGHGQATNGGMDVFSVLVTPDRDGDTSNGITTTTTNKTDSVKHREVPPDIMAPNEEMRLMAFVKNKRVLMTTIMSCYMWFAENVTYYGMLMMSTSLTDSLYLGVFLSVVVEIPTAVIFIFAIDRLGRKSFLVVCHILAGLSPLTATVLSNVSFAADVPGMAIIIICVTLLGKFAVSTAFSVLWLYSAELYPTNLRNTGFGISSVVGRIGGMVAPYSRTFSRYVPWGPGAVFTCLCLLVPVALHFLPETSGKELPQTLADLERMFEPKKPTPKEKTQDNTPC